jgi:hypothetical protein
MLSCYLLERSAVYAIITKKRQSIMFWNMISHLITKDVVITLGYTERERERFISVSRLTKHRLPR